MVNGQNLFVTCPPSARPGSDVRIFPPAPPTTQSQMYEVVVPAGVRSGQPFALVANGQRVLVTCPTNAGPGQKIRFLLPTSLGKEQIDSVKLRYDKEGWSRCLGMDLKFHWFRNEGGEGEGEGKEGEGKDDEESKSSSSSPSGFDVKTTAFVRKLEYKETPSSTPGGAPTTSTVLSLVPAVSAVSETSCLGRDGKNLVTYQELASQTSKTFKEKVKWFQKKCLDLRTPWEEDHTFVFVRRSHLMEDALKSLMMMGPEKLHNMLRFEFIGEPGIDAGGVAREFFQLTSEQVFHPDVGLWQYSAVNQMCMQINASSGMAMEDHLVYFRFVGRLLGKALFDGQIVATHMIRHLYKHLLGWPLMFEDIEMIDDEIYRSLQQMLEIDDVEMLYLNFTVSEESLGETKVVELVPGGTDVDVTNDNLKEFMEASLRYRVLDRVGPQLKELLQGFYEVVPEPLLTIFDFQELELLMCGLPDISIEDWKVNTEYVGHYEGKKEGHKVTRWFWEVVEGFDQELRARLLQFVTGTSGVPAQGFSCLQGNDGNIRRFTINSINLSSSLFPRAHTCFNRIDLPLYTSKEQLKDKLTLAVQMEATGFDID